MPSIEKKIWKQFQKEVGDSIGKSPEFSRYDSITLNMDYEGGNQAPATGGKRIDGVIETGEKVWVCEVKPILDYESLGQVMAYTAMYRNYKEVGERDLLPLVIFAQTTSRSEGILQATEIWGIGTFQIRDDDLQTEVWEKNVSKKEKKKRRRMVEKIEENF